MIIFILFFKRNSNSDVFLIFPKVTFFDFMNLQKIIEAKNTIFGKNKKTSKFWFFSSKNIKFHQNFIIFKVFFNFSFIFSIFNFSNITFKKYQKPYFQKMQILQFFSSNFINFAHFLLFFTFFVSKILFYSQDFNFVF